MMTELLEREALNQLGSNKMEDLGMLALEVESSLVYDVACVTIVEKTSVH